jgi:hypothetical protein
MAENVDVKINSSVTTDCKTTLKTEISAIDSLQAALDALTLRVEALEHAT